MEESILISQKSIIKLSLLYILKLFLTVIASMLIMSVMTIIIRFIPNVSNTNTENLLIAIVAGIAEIIVFFFIFYKEFYNDKNSDIKCSLISFSITLVLQFVIAFINHFYTYTAGSCVTYSGIFFYYLNSPSTYQTQTSPSDISSIYFIVPIIILDILLIGTLYLSFILAKRTAKKEKESIINNKNLS